MVKTFSYKQIDANMKQGTVDTQDIKDESEIAELTKEFEKRNASFYSNNTPSVIENTINNNVVTTCSSAVGQFGWEEVKECCISIPYILRGDHKYVPHRIVRKKIWNTFIPYFTDDVFGSLELSLHNISPDEAILLDEINFKHCDSTFGHTKFTVKETLMSLEAFRDSFQFLLTAFNILIRQDVNNDKCGFMKINEEHVPFIHRNGRKALPTLYFEGENEYLQSKSFDLSHQEMVYLRFCCKLQEIKKQHYEVPTCKAIYLEDLKYIFSPTSTFESDWPKKINLNLLKSFGKQRRLQKLDVKTPKLRISVDIYTKAVHCFAPTLTGNRTLSQAKWPLPRNWKNPYSRTINFEEVEIPRELTFPYKLFQIPLGTSSVPCVNMLPYIQHPLLISIDFSSKYYFYPIVTHKVVTALEMVGLTIYGLNSMQARAYHKMASSKSAGLFVRLDELTENLDTVKYIAFDF